MQLKNILNQVISLSNEVGHFIRTESQEFDTSKIEIKGLNDLVSYVDKNAEMQLVDGLRKILPQAGFITEEGTVNVSEAELTWVIDPLDGTTNFVHGLPVFAISIALLRNNLPILGVVDEVNRQECFYAIENEPAYCNQKLIQVSSQGKLSASLLATGFPYNTMDRLTDYMKILMHFMEKTHGIRRIGSAAVDLAYVACGRFQGFFEYNLKPWDVAAGAFIVQQAGGVVTDFKGGEDFIFGREIIAANGIHGEMLEVIQQSW